MGSKMNKLEEVISGVYIKDGMFAGSRGFSSIYLIDSDGLLIVDAGTSGAVSEIMDAIAELGSKPSEVEWILITHMHLDHAGGAGYLAEKLRNAKFIAHPAAIPHLVNPERLYGSAKRVLGAAISLYGEVKPLGNDRIVPASNGMSIKSEGADMEVVYTPGHASHHISFLEKGRKILFSGDAAGICYGKHGIVFPATPPPDFNFEQYTESLSTIRDSEAETILYAHYGKGMDKNSEIDRCRELIEEQMKIVNDNYMTNGERAAIEAFCGKYVGDAKGVQAAESMIVVNALGIIGYIKQQHREGRL